MYLIKAPHRVLARSYLMTLYVIFSIDLNFPIRYKRVFKAITPRIKTMDCFTVAWEQKHLSAAICVVCHALKYFFPKWRFPAFCGLYQKNYFRQPWWRPLVNTCQISQFRENVSSFNFLGNALPHGQNFWQDVSQRD